MQEDCIVLGGAHQLLVHLVGPQRAAVFGGILPHGQPGVGNHHVRPRGVHLVGDGHGRPGQLGTLLGALHELRLRLEALRRGDRDVHSRCGESQHVAVSHVVRAVAEVHRVQPLELALVLLDGYQVGEDLAGVEIIGQGVDDRYAGGLRHLVEVVVSAGAPDDRGDVAGQDRAGVLEGFPLPHLRASTVYDDGVAAQLGDAGVKRKARARRGFVE